MGTAKGYTSDGAATVYSIGTQLEAFSGMALGPLLGWLADLSGITTVFTVAALVMLVFYPLLMLGQ